MAFSALYARAVALTIGDGFVITEGFPLCHYALGDAGTLMEFRWSLFVINLGIGVVALVTLFRTRVGPFLRRQRAQFIAGSAFAAGYTWVNSDLDWPGFPFWFDLSDRGFVLLMANVVHWYSGAVWHLSGIRRCW